MTAPGPPAVTVTFAGTGDAFGSAAFYSDLLGQPVTYESADWVVVAACSAASGLAFQLSTDYRRPTWPEPGVSQQVHLDIMVEDPAGSGPRVLALGATKLDGDDVYADPAGHPFCLIRRPGWARRFRRASSLGRLGRIWNTASSVETIRAWR